MAKKQYSDMEKLKASIKKEFGQDVFIESDTLESALNRMYLLNRADKQAEEKSKRNIAKQREAFVADLQAQLDAGSIDQDDFNDELDEFNRTHRPMYAQVKNLLVMGEPGGGKTSIIEQWANSKGVQLLVVTASDLSVSITRGLPYAQERNVTDAEYIKQLEARGLSKTVKYQDYLPSTFFDGLDDPDAKYTVLFIDEINRMRTEVESALLTLVQDRTINNKYEQGGRHFFNKMLFTIAAMNPPDTSSEVRRLGLALSTRFKLFIWNSNPLEMKKFWDEQFQDMIDNADDPDDPLDVFNKTRATGAKKILDALVDSGKFQFADHAETMRVGDQTKKSGAKATEIHVVNARTLATALTSCDGRIGLDPNGPDGDRYPVGSFMYEFRNSCTENPVVLRQVAKILENLQDDMDSEANQFQNTLWGKYTLWKRDNRGKYGL